MTNNFSFSERWTTTNPSFHSDPQDTRHKSSRAEGLQARTPWVPLTKWDAMSLPLASNCSKLLDALSTLLTQAPPAQVTFTKWDALPFRFGSNTCQLPACRFLNHPKVMDRHPRDCAQTEKRRFSHAIGTHLFGSSTVATARRRYFSSCSSLSLHASDSSGCVFVSVRSLLTSRSELKPFKWLYAAPVHEITPLDIAI